MQISFAVNVSVIPVADPHNAVIELDYCKGACSVRKRIELWFDIGVHCLREGRSGYLAAAKETTLNPASSACSSALSA